MNHGDYPRGFPSMDDIAEKDEMKLPVPALIILALLSCESIPRLENGRVRLTVEGSGNGGNPSKNIPDTNDTFHIYVSGVRVPESYDWQRDTACGLASCEAVLFRDGMEILSFPTGYANGVSTEPDSYHLIGGHLYTEFADADGTIIKRDGALLFRYPGREYLSGLLVSGDDIYTLGSSKSGAGFSFRRNGEAIIVSSNGEVDGGFHYPGGARNGALFGEDGHIWFSYKDRSGPQMFYVRDGGISPFSPSDVEIHNLRVWNGVSCFVFTQSRSDATFLHTASGNILLGYRNKLNDTMLGIVSGRLFCILFTNGATTLMEYGGFEFEYDPEADIRIVADEQLTDTIVIDKEGVMEVYEDGALYWMVDPCFLFNPASAMLHDGSLYMAVTPRAKGEKPYLWKDGDVMTTFGMNGFLTGVEYCVSPPK